MKKLIAMIALAAICMGSASVYASSTPVMAQDTMKKMKMKKKMKDTSKMKMKMKKMKKDTTKM